MKEEKDLISVLMPTYNVEKYVEEAVRSILDQTWKNFELIIVDDCSTDKTFAILQKLAQEDLRIKLYRNEANLKICKTLNRAWSYATGNYIARMDGDDVSTPDRFQVLMNFLYTHKKCGLVGSGMITIDETGKELSYSSLVHSNYYIKKVIKYRSPIAHIWIARREVYEKLKGYREIPYAEDADFIFRCVRNGFELANVREYLYKCRIRNGNTSSTNGVIQSKTFDYVYKLYLNECRQKKELFSERNLQEHIKSSSKENKSYFRSYYHLMNALKNKRKPFLFIVNTIMALSNYWTRKYIFNSIAFRFYVLKEKNEY